MSAIANLVAIELVLLNASSGGNAGRTAEVTFAVTSLVVSWTLVLIIFTLRYASLFCSGGTEGGTNFHQDPPRYSDFA